MNRCITTVLGTCRVCISFDEAKVSTGQGNLCMPETFERCDNHAYMENNFNGMKHFAVYLFIPKLHYFLLYIAPFPQLKERNTETKQTVRFQGLLRVTNEIARK